MLYFFLNFASLSSRNYARRTLPIVVNTLREQLSSPMHMKSVTWNRLKAVRAGIEALQGKPGSRTIVALVPEIRKRQNKQKIR
nr:hypothetical protein [Candidatus Njordarchaeum guaymaensis]